MTNLPNRTTRGRKPPRPLASLSGRSRWCDSDGGTFSTVSPAAPRPHARGCAPGMGHISNAPPLPRFNRERDQILKSAFKMRKSKRMRFQIRPTHISNAFGPTRPLTGRSVAEGSGRRDMAKNVFRFAWHHQTIAEQSRGRAWILTMRDNSKQLKTWQEMLGITVRVEPFSLA